MTEYESRRRDEEEEEGAEEERQRRKEEEAYWRISSIDIFAALESEWVDSVRISSTLALISNSSGTICCLVGFLVCWCRSVRVETLRKMMKGLGNGSE